jgi:hypothetical protein
MTEQEENDFRAAVIQVMVDDCDVDEEEELVQPRVEEVLDAVVDEGNGLVSFTVTWNEDEFYTVLVSLNNKYAVDFDSGEISVMEPADLVQKIVDWETKAQDIINKSDELLAILDRK